jgi:hypothetical protein
MLRIFISIISIIGIINIFTTVSYAENDDLTTVIKYRYRFIKKATPVSFDNEIDKNTYKAIAKAGDKFKVISIDGDKVIIEIVDLENNRRFGNIYKINSNVFKKNIIEKKINAKKEGKNTIYSLKEKFNFNNLNSKKNIEMQAGSQFYKFDYYESDNYDYFIFVDKIANQNDDEPPIIGNVQLNELYYIDKDDFKIKEYNFCWGLFFSGLYLPFKYRLKTGKTKDQIEPSINLSGAFGIKSAISIGFFGFAGLSSISMASINSSDNNAQNELKFGLCFGGGISYDIPKNNSQIFGVIGWDKLAGSEGQKWDYELKPWISFGVGYKIF